MFHISCHCFSPPPPPPPRLVRPTLIARNGQYVTGSALGEVRLREVDLGLHDDRALPPVHAALDGTGDVDLQLPLLAAEETIKDGGQRDRETEREREVIGYWQLETFTDIIKVYS